MSPNLLISPRSSRATQQVSEIDPLELIDNDGVVHEKQEKYAKGGHDVVARTP